MQYDIKVSSSVWNIILSMHGGYPSISFYVYIALPGMWIEKILIYLLIL